MLVLKFLQEKVLSKLPQQSGIRRFLIFKVTTTHISSRHLVL